MGEGFGNYGNLCYSISGIVFYAFNPNFIRFTSFILTEFTDIISLIGYCIYLEIIELNFCGLSNNLRRKIKDKGESEVNDIILGKISNNDDLFSLNNEEDESNYKDNILSKITIINKCSKIFKILLLYNYFL